MNCPRCGDELHRSKKEPDVLVCYNCKVKYKSTKKQTISNNKKCKSQKNRKGCLKIFLIVFAVFVVITAISSLTGKENRGAGKKTAETKHKEEQNEINEINEINDINKEDYIARFKNQKNALDSLISRYESGEESAGTTAERLEGLADGIQNTINSISGKDGSEDAVSYGTALKGIASHYAQYLKTGDQSEMDDVNALEETIE